VLVSTECVSGMNQVSGAQVEGVVGMAVVSAGRNAR
jgi:hypothetical protein